MSINTKDRTYYFLALLTLAGIMFGELFEQIVFVPNWLIGNIEENVANFSKFKHIADPGMFYFPMSLATLIGHVMLLRKASSLSTVQKDYVKKSLYAFLVVLALTGYVIAAINVPAFDQRVMQGAELESAVKTWAVLNIFRIVLPAYGILSLMKVVGDK